MEAPYFIERPPPGVAVLPIVVSVPHSGTQVPAAVAAAMRPEIARGTPDTDWFVHELYGFAPALGITLLHARFSRLVIDLNRDPTGHKLYADGRSETQLVPLKTFAGESVYPGTPPDAAEIERRMAAIFRPYHARADELLAELQGAGHRHVLLWDAHSIQRCVPSVRAAPFADMILGNQGRKTAAGPLIDAALDTLSGGAYEVAHNTPFMGGFLTRSKGRPDAGVHALQLEMAQDVYMDEKSAARDPAQAGKIQPLLKKTLLALAAELARLP